MDVLLGIGLGVLLGEAVRFVLRLIHPQLGPTGQPLPCIGQRWRLQGVGLVEVVGLKVATGLGLILTVEYAYESGEGLLKGAAPLEAFLQNANLWSTPDPTEGTH